MKRIVFSLFFLFYSITMFAQSANVQAANNFIKDKKLAKAKEAIDAAAAYESTANDPMMWYFRGVIYSQISRDTTDLGKSEPDAAEKAAVSFINNIKTDKGKYNSEDSYSRVWGAGYELYRKAAKASNAGDYERANRFYNLIFEVIPYDRDNNLKHNEVTPETINYNLYTVAMKSGDKAKAKVYLQKLIDAKYNKPAIYVYMNQLYLESHDTAGAMAVIEKGRALYEEDMGLINAQVKLYIDQGRTGELIDQLTKTIDGGVENEVLYLVRASLYKERKDFDKAEDDLKKAIEIKPDYLEATYRLGATYFSHAAALSKEAASLKGDEIEKARVKIDEKFKAAQTYFEKSMELNPKKTDNDQLMYKGAVSSLTQIYQRTNQAEKLEQLKAQADKK